MDKYKKVRLITKKRFNEFQTYFRGFAPPEASDLLEKARLDWLYELTKTLDIWQTNYYTNGNLTDGELILGYANLGALVEGCNW